MTLDQWRRERDDFFHSREWKELRYIAIKRDGRRCLACGRGPVDGIVIHVDHIVPISKDWSKRLDIRNLQVLCEDCNIGKSNKDSTNWTRPSNEIKSECGFVVLTKEVLDSLRTNSAFTKATTIALLGTKEQPKAGWVKAITGTSIPEDRFLKAKDGVGKLVRKGAK
jgi:hypothetical protein